jgi:hypothetical protein
MHLRGFIKGIRSSDRQMAEELDRKETVDLKELLMSEVIQSEAIINLLDRKGIISKHELMEEMKQVQASMARAER